MTNREEMPITQAVDVNPAVKLVRGQEYAFVEMANLSEGITRVRSPTRKEFGGSGARFQLGDTLFARITPCLENGKIAKFVGEGEVGFGSTEFIVFRGREGVTTTDYAHYLATDPIFRGFAVSKMTGSSGRQRVPIEALDHYNVQVPPLAEQKAVTKILGDLDDKIDLLREMNRTLEGIVRAVFRAWFVDFEPVRIKAAGATSFRGMPQKLFDALPNTLQRSDNLEIPSGWKVDLLENLVLTPITRGLAPKYVISGGVSVLNQKCVRNWEVNFDLARRHDDEAKPTKGKIVEHLDILVNSTGVGTLGRVAQVYSVREVTTFDSHLSLVRPDATKIGPLYLGYNLTEREHEIERLGHGSTGQTELSRQKLGGLRVVVPQADAQTIFGNLISPLVEREEQNRHEIETLSAIRDALLPGLISGELVAPTLEALGVKAVGDGG